MKLRTNIELDQEAWVFWDAKIGDRSYEVHIIQHKDHLIMSFGLDCRIVIDKNGVATFEKSVNGHWDSLQIQDSKNFVYHPEKPYQSTGRQLVQIPTGLGNS